jgi:hypothetical protein
MTKHKTPSSPGFPKQCPRGHKHLSWSPGEKEFFCWDCHSYYPVSEYLSQPKDIDWKEEEPEE